MLKTTMGQLLVNDSLPEDLRDYGRILDKKGMATLLRTVAEKYPDQYRDVSKKLADIGRNVASEFGGNSFGLAHMAKSGLGQQYQKNLQAKLKQILDDDNLDDAKRQELIVKAAGMDREKQMKSILEEAIKNKNPLASQVISGSRGNEMNLASLLDSDRLYSDHRDQPLAIPIVHSYSQGLRPIEYWAGTYGARKGVMATKFATQDAGFLSKQLNQVAHRLMVVDEDDPRYEGDPTPRGLPVDTDDPDNEGALLGMDVGPYKRNTALTPKILKDLKRRGHARLLVRSPVVGGSPDGGIYARDVGVRERGTLPGRGEQVGLTAAQALSEPLSQGQLSAKHSGGVAGQEKAVGGFQYINQLIQVPKVFKGGAAHSNEDGSVERIEEGPAGGQFVWINGKRHYVGEGFELKVKPGDQVEAGDLISEGLPNLNVVVDHKGRGEGARYFVNSFVDAMRGAGLKVNRRNVEVLARGLINHVRLTDEFQGNLPDDVVPYSTLEHLYEPREGHQTLRTERALGQYLERPVLHYSIGTKVRPSVLKELQQFGIKEVAVHAEPPPFKSEMIRGMYSLQHDPDWMTRMYGSGQKSSLLEAVHRGRSSNELGTSFVPGLARAEEFGRVGQVRQPLPGTKPPLIEPVTEDEEMPKKKPTTPPTSPIALNLQPPKTPAPKSMFGGMGSIFKLSCDALEQRREAEILLEKAAKRIEQVRQATAKTKQTQQVKASAPLQPVRRAQQIKTAETNIGSSTVTAGGTTIKPSSQGSAAPKPPTPAAPPGGDAWSGPRGPANPTFGVGRNPHALGQGGYNPGMPSGIVNDPEAFSRFVDSSQRFGGLTGGAVAFGSGLDQNAVATLTNQSPYVKGHYGYSEFDRPTPPGYHPGIGRPGMRGGQPGRYGGHPGMQDADGMDFDGGYPGFDPWQDQGGQQQTQQQAPPQPGFGAGDMLQMAPGITSMGSTGAQLGGLATRGLGAAANATGATRVGGALGRTGGALGRAGGLVGKAATPLAVAVDTGQMIGHSINDIRNGQFFGGNGEVAQGTRRTMDEMNNATDLSRWTDPNVSKFDQLMDTTHLINPVSYARSAGGVIGDVANTAIYDMPAILGGDFKDMTRLESSSNIGKHFESQQKIQQMLSDDQHKKTLAGKQDGINPFQFTPHFDPNKDALTNTYNSLTRSKNPLANVIGTAQDLHTSVSTMKGQTEGQARGFEQIMSDRRAANEQRATQLRDLKGKGFALSPEEQAIVAKADADRNKTEAQLVLEASGFKPGDTNTALYMTMGHKSINPFDGEQRASALNPVSGRRLAEEAQTAIDHGDTGQRVAGHAVKDFTSPVASWEQIRSGDFRVPGWNSVKSLWD